MTVGTKGGTQTSSICGGGPPHACAVMPWGGDSYFMLGVGGCNYDASTSIFYRIMYVQVEYWLCLGFQALNNKEEER